MSGPWCEAPVVNAAADAGGVIEVVPTEDYEAKKGPGVAAPSPGHECVYVYPWPEAPTSTGGQTAAQSGTKSSAHLTARRSTCAPVKQSGSCPRLASGCRCDREQPFGAVRVTVDEFVEQTTARLTAATYIDGDQDLAADHVRRVLQVLFDTGALARKWDAMRAAEQGAA